MKKKPLWRKTIKLKNDKRVIGISEEKGFGIINCVFHITEESGQWKKEARKCSRFTGQDLSVGFP